MSIRDLNDSPYRPHPAPPPAPETGDPWAERFAEERRTRAERIATNPADERGPEEPRGYRVRSEDVWQAARREYVAGFPAEAVCAQFDLGLSAFRQRARREGWRRSDVEAEPPEPLGFPPEPEAAAPTPELVDLSWRSAAQAIRRGRVYEARAWMRLWNELKAVVRAEAEAVRLAELRAARDAAAVAVEDAQLHPLHPEDGVQSQAAQGAAKGVGAWSAETLPDSSADARVVAKALTAVQTMLAMTTPKRPP